jgi:hypothetical protein
MKKNNKPLKSVLPAAILLLGGCAHQYHVEPHFGSAVREAIARQTINSGGVGHDGVSPGMDGASAKATVDRYIRSTEQPPALGDVFRVGVGDGEKGSGLVSVPAAR